MAPRSPSPRDWRDAGHYAGLRDLPRPAFAWEWLRRDPAYRKAAGGAADSARPRACAPRFLAQDPRAFPFGLHAFEDPGLAAPLARPVWRSAFDPQVLEVRAGPGGAEGDCFELAALGALATLVSGAGGSEHLLLSDGRCSIRLDASAGGLAGGPLLLHYLLRGMKSAEPGLVALGRFIALCRNGGFTRGLHPADVRAGRWILLLRASDALAAGSSQREIAAHLLGREAGAPRWRIEAPTLRSRVQRLVRQARAMAAGSYLELLR